MKHRSLLPLLAALALPSCHHVAGDRPDDGGPGTPFGSDELIFCDELSYASFDGYDLLTLDMDGDDLLIEVGYSGGCQEHEWALCWIGGAGSESYPPTVEVQLHHDAHGDMCLAYVQTTLRFDVSLFKEEFTYGIKMCIDGGDPEGPLCVLYVF